MPTFSEIVDSFGASITGGKDPRAVAAANTQTQALNEAILAEQLAEFEIKNNPVLIKEKNKQILIFIGGVIVVVILLKIFKVF